ncbi:hypothetical protein LIER_36025 [Lithospermum erythrorhizon]|uniref:Uncharacterized protein n=1 Tax=Lithospermum erythrorhizon TaxID=34254 RepID=A0AAV3NZK1_LITER
MQFNLQCDELWIGKAHIPRIAKLHGLSKLTSYNLSMKDGKRTRITKDDLVDHDWEFHFTEEAPDYWRNLDPFWTGEGPLMRRYFHADGTLTADEGDKVWGGHESCYSVITSFFGDGRIRENYVRVNRWPPMSITRKPDWSWELINRIYVYTSIADAEKEAGTGPLFYAF